MQNKKKRCFLNLVRFSQKSEGSTAGRLLRLDPFYQLAHMMMSALFRIL